MILCQYSYFTAPDDVYNNTKLIKIFSVEPEIAYAALKSCIMRISKSSKNV